MIICSDPRLVQLPPIATPHQHRAVPVGEASASDLPPASLGTALRQDPQLPAVCEAPSIAVQLHLSALPSSVQCPRLTGEERLVERQAEEATFRRAQPAALGSRSLRG